MATISAVGTAHFTSHLLQLAFAPLFLTMRDDLGVTFTELGALLSAFYLASGMGQVTAGILVDRFGAHRLLLAGMALQASSVAAIGLAPTYGLMLPLAFLSGLGNAVYHPADLSILSHRIRPERLGRAFAAHVIAGNFGYAVSPLMSGTLAIAFGWRTALVVMGGAALVATFALIVVRPVLHSPTIAEQAKAPGGVAPISFGQVLTTPVVLLAFFYFLLSSISLVGIQNFSIAALQEAMPSPPPWRRSQSRPISSPPPRAWPSGAMWRTPTIHRIAILAAIAMRGAPPPRAACAALASLHLPLALATTALVVGIGFANGPHPAVPRRVVRRASTAGATGKVFGVVYSGFDIGSLFAPLIYGLLMDHHLPHGVFLTAPCRWRWASSPCSACGRASAEGKSL